MTNTTMPNLQDLKSKQMLSLIRCPYFDVSHKVCTAAQHFLTPGDKYQAGYCGTDDYDDCPLYLCQALRSSQTLGHDRESIKSSGK
jgi:hypothetical protein